MLCNNFLPVALATEVVVEGLVNYAFEEEGWLIFVDVVVWVCLLIFVHTMPLKGGGVGYFLYLLNVLGRG